ncbi:hypothetical protein Cgig2_008678 [Carnegiea gigantea]|uniref:Uncharacterized protein n=1 Tax=Carnegiea gigantea TaxID=171969 RepID=A0A9Q1JWY7_9CARY|nr:hypothetical protein Cgig2_008678 [Carnegiea gigantea]
MQEAVSSSFCDLEIGIGLTGFGVFFTFLGVIFLFDKGLLAMGNILFLSGLGLTIGLKSTMQFFMKPQNFKVLLFLSPPFDLPPNFSLSYIPCLGTFSFGIGFFFVVIVMMDIDRNTFLCSGFLPTLVVFLQRIPFLGWVLQLPFIRSFVRFYFRPFHKMITFPEPILVHLSKNLFQLISGSMKYPSAKLPVRRDCQLNSVFGLLIDTVEDGCLSEIKSLRRSLMQDQLVTEFR